MRVRSIVSIVSLVGLTACAGDVAVERVGLTPPPNLDVVAETARASPLTAELPAALLSAMPSMRREESGALAAFYHARDFAPVWFDGGAYADVRVQVEAALLGAPTTSREVPAAHGPAEEALREVALSLAALRVAAEPGSLTDPASDALAGALARAVDRTSRPVTDTPAFGGQALAAARYRTIVAAGGWPVLPRGEKIEPGDAAPHLDVLRRRLEITGDLEAGTSTGPVYDRTLVDAVERFQARHGLAVDGVVGPATRRALNVPASARLAQIERAGSAVARFAVRLPERYVLVNLPAYELRYVRGGEVRHGARVVVGSVNNPTPAFADAIEHLIFNPYWHVPASIAREELVFDFKEDAAAMAARGFQLVDASGAVADPTAVDWATITPAALPFRFRQGPGGANALGRVKFMFPNEHAIYLHDTPSRHLFERASRAFSHGCIRVQDPLVLAERLLETDGWSRQDIDRWLASGETRRVPLTRPVPVHLVYVTAWRDAQGVVQFRSDVYGREGSPAP